MGGHDNCCIKGCPNVRTTSELSFFKFPDYPEDRVHSWILASGHKGAKKSWKICGAHFVLGKPSPNSEHVDYVPTLHLPSTIAKKGSCFC